MSEALTSLDEFQRVPVPPSTLSMQAQPEYEFGNQIRGMLGAAAIGLCVISAPLLPSDPAAPTQVILNGTPHDVRRTSPAALTRRSTQTRMEEFAKVVGEAIELSNTMVAEDEAAPINEQTLAYATDVLAPFIAVMQLPLPLMLPLQNGGIGAEWHELGMNIELRFRNPYHVYAVLEDARGVIPNYHGRDPHLVRARMALREFFSRAVE